MRTNEHNFLEKCRINREYSAHYYEVTLRDGKVAIVPKEFIPLEVQRDFYFGGGIAN